MSGLTGIIETAVQVRDLNAAIDFYQRVLGLQVIDGNERFCALSVAGRDVLLLFLEGASSSPVDLPGGRIPAHESQGSSHLAFSLERAHLGEWQHRLKENGVEIESRVEWERGGTSLYFRDPDSHLLELATPGIWSVY
jgi:catechol 2,3-dioxygenase-like lactoylglutathione lyase family enzyme